MFDRKKKGLWWDAALRVNSGCTKVSPGCDHCWAETELAIRSKSPNAKIAAQWPGNFQGDVRLLPDNLEKVLKARTPKAWSVWNDLFHKEVPDEYRDRVLGTFAVAHEQLGIILTKRPDQMAEYLVATKRRCPPQAMEQFSVWTTEECISVEADWKTICCSVANKASAMNNADKMPWPLSNVWLGTTAEDQQRLEERAVHLLKCPASLLFLSLEPLLGPMTFADVTPKEYWCPECEEFSDCPEKYLCDHCSEESSSSPEDENGDIKCKHCHEIIDEEQPVCPGCGHAFATHMLPYGPFEYFMESDRQEAVMDKLGWVIVGGESRGGGIGRECRIEWVRAIVEQCKAAGVPVFVKQLHIDGKLVKDIEKFPEDLRLREIPVFGKQNFATEENE